MSTIPIGGIVFACIALLAVRPIRRPRALATPSLIVSAFPNELPFVFLALVVVSDIPVFTDERFTTAGDWISLIVLLVTVVALGIVVHRSLLSGRVADRALAALVTGWRRRLPWLRILFLPVPFRPRDVERTANIPYGDHGKDNLLDVYRHRSHPSGAPTLVYLHGGRFRRGRKNFEARPLVHHLARQGWTCISANYRLTPTPAQGFPDHLIDVKQVIAWARTHAPEHGIDPSTIFMAGSSAGAHLTAMAALTENDPTFQPGFETADTSLAGGIGLYGYYGPLDGDEHGPSAPLAHAHPEIPPLFVAHGDRDTYTPVEGARHLVAGLRAVSNQPVVYVELPGAQHSFDVFHSIRFETTVDAVEAFTAWVRSTRPHARAE